MVYSHSDMSEPLDISEEVWASATLGNWTYYHIDLGKHGAKSSASGSEGPQFKPQSVLYTLRKRKASAMDKTSHHQHNPS